MAWLISHGTDQELLGVRIAQWIAFGLCVIILLLYAWHSFKVRCRCPVLPCA